MAVELTYALITPYSLLKSRTGGIIGRLLSLTNLDFVGARIYAPSDAFVDEYRASIEAQDIEPTARTALLQYVDDHLRPDNVLGITNRCVVLLFQGPEAVEHLRRDVVGAITLDPRGDTVRGTFGDFVELADGSVRYFEPAVLIAADPASNRRQLEILSRFDATDGGIFENLVPYPPGVQKETTLVILKPENFERRSSRAGNIIDIFSKTGLYMVGMKLLRMSVAQAEEFYGPLKAVFVRKLKHNVVQTLRESLRGVFDFAVTDAVLEAMAELLKEANAECEFNRIVQYMTGIHPTEVKSEPMRTAPGREKCLAVLYQGDRATAKIRERLGATQPSEAVAGSVRSDFGRDLMRNAAHASDSPESAERERKIIGLWRETGPSDVKQLIDAYLAGEDAVSGQ